mmetsp:Transcript_28577/g.80555  ORF Transcript_28577/g.80555 Transcript_28577/m.80555 type:complete len:333 (+) Transcript_28577:112-1110(+)
MDEPFAGMNASNMMRVCPLFLCAKTSHSNNASFIRRRSHPRIRSSLCFNTAVASLVLSFSVSNSATAGDDHSPLVLSLIVAHANDGECAVQDIDHAPSAGAGRLLTVLPFRCADGTAPPLRSTADASLRCRARTEEAVSAVLVAAPSAVGLRDAVRGQRLQHLQPMRLSPCRIVRVQVDGLDGSLEGAAHVLNFLGDGLVLDGHAVLQLPLVDLEPQLRVGDELGVGQGPAGERARVVASVEPFHDGFPFVVDAVAVHERVRHDLQRDAALELFGDLAVVVVIICIAVAAAACAAAVGFGPWLVVARLVSAVVVHFFAGACVHVHAHGGRWW